MTLYDRDIRAALHAHLAPRKAGGALVVNEMGVYWGDVIAITNKGRRALDGARRMDHFAKGC